MRTTHITHQGYPARQYDLTVPESKIRDFVEDCEDHGDPPSSTLLEVKAFMAREGMAVQDEFLAFLNLIPPVD